MLYTIHYILYIYGYEYTVNDQLSGQDLINRPLFGEKFLVSTQVQMSSKVRLSTLLILRVNLNKEKMKIFMISFRGKFGRNY